MARAWLAQVFSVPIGITDSACSACTSILRAERHEFVGNLGESEVRAHLRGQANPHSACQRYALVVVTLDLGHIGKVPLWGNE
jgi:hypothetical protein